MKRTVLSLATAGALLLAGATSASAVAAVPYRPDATPQVQVWTTTGGDADGQAAPAARRQLLTHEAPVSFTGGSTDLPTITVDPWQTYQRMDGFGGALTDSSAVVLSKLKPDVLAETMTRLFDPDRGIGVSFLRQPIGSSDFTAAAEHYTFDDVAPGAKDFALEHFSIAHDEKLILPLLRQAKKLNSKLTIMATPWSPPAWMKTTDSLVGGRLIDEPRYYRAYAAYLVKFVQAYQRAGIPVDYLSVQNEPQNRTPDGYPGTDMPPNQEIAVISALGPLLHRASPHTKILGYDHNWAVHPNDLKNLPPGETPAPDYAENILDSSAARWVAGTAYHCYYGDPSAMSTLHAAHPDKGIWFTECSSTTGVNDGVPDSVDKTFLETLKWHSRNVDIGNTRNWARSVANWNIALDENHGPHNGGCDTCDPMVTVLNDGTVRFDANFYTVGQLSKFVKPGAVRIASTSFGTTSWNGMLMDTAFRNPDGSTALVVHNEYDHPRAFSVAVGTQHFTSVVPGASLTTFTWPASLRLVEKSFQIPLPGATVTASSNGADGAKILDADATTSWQSGASQTPGQFVQVDLGGTKLFSRIAVDHGMNFNWSGDPADGDYARGYRIETSLDGKHWAPYASNPANKAYLINADHRWTVARYVRVTGTGNAGNWWSIADFRLYL